MMAFKTDVPTSTSKKCSQVFSWSFDCVKSMLKMAAVKSRGKATYWNTTVRQKYDVLEHQTHHSHLG